MSKAGNRLKYQVEKALKSINFINQSKKEHRDNKMDTGIHSISQMKHALSASQNFADWLQNEKAVDDLFKLKRAHYRNYIEHLRNKGLSIGHIINVETNLRLLAKGMDKISIEKGMKLRDWVPSERIIMADEKEKPKDRSYNIHELELFYKNMSENARIASDLQIAFGLRLKEAAKSRVAHIEERNGRLYWVAVDDKNAINKAKGVTKGGRPRKALCHPIHEERIHELIKDKQLHQFISPLTYNSVKNAYYRAGVGKGSHGYRHTYAREMLRLELERRGIEKEGVSMIQRMLENKAAGYRKDYLVIAAERPLYKQVNEVVDLIHEYLGHGKGRMDLCEVYMKGVMFE